MRHGALEKHPERPCVFCRRRHLQDFDHLERVCRADSRHVSTVVMPQNLLGLFFSKTGIFRVKFCERKYQLGLLHRCRRTRGDAVPYKHAAAERKVLVSKITPGKILLLKSLSTRTANACRATKPNPAAKYARKPRFSPHEWGAGTHQAKNQKAFARSRSLLRYIERSNHSNRFPDKAHGI